MICRKILRAVFMMRALTLLSIGATMPAAVVWAAAPDASSTQNNTQQSSDAHNAVNQGQENAVKAEQEGDNQQPPARPEPKPLTFQGGVGLVVIIAAIGGFTYWALRPMSSKLQEDEENGAQQASSHAESV